MLASLRTKFLLPTFYVFFRVISKKCKKSRVFRNLKKNEKYVFSNTALKSSLLTRAPDWRRPRRHPCCCCCCRSTDVLCPYARRQNASPHAEMQATVSAVVEPIDTHDLILLSFNMFDFLSWCPVPQFQRPLPEQESKQLKSKDDGTRRRL